MSRKLGCRPRQAREFRSGRDRIPDKGSHVRLSARTVAVLDFVQGRRILNKLNGYCPI